MAEWQRTPLQRAAMSWLDGRDSAILALPTSAGKTALGLTWVDQAMVDGVAMALVVAPNKVVDQWATEAGKWDHLGWVSRQIDRLRFEDLGMIRGSNDELVFQDKRAAKRWLKERPGRVHVIPWSMFSQVEEAWGKNWPYEAIVFDESDKLGNWGSGVTKAARRIRREHPDTRMLLLAATPAANNRDALHPQVELVHPGLLGRTLTEFRDTWCEPDTVNRQTGQVWRWRIAKAKSDLFATVVSTVMATAEDPLGIRVEVVEHVVEPPDDVVFWADELSRTSVVKQLGIRCPGKAQVRSKLRQMFGGAVYRQDDDDPVQLHTAKVDALMELAESGRQMVIVNEWRHEEARLKALLGSRYQHVRENGAKGRFLASQTQFLGLSLAQGHGLDGLQAVSSDIVFMTVPLDLALYTQCVGRLKRFGQRSDRVLVHMLMCGPEDRRALDEVLPGKQKTEVDPVRRACRLSVDLPGQPACHRIPSL